MNEKKWVLRCVIAVFAVFACVGFSSCVDDTKDLYVGDETVEPNDFDFSTKKTVDINLTYDVPAGYRVQFEMYTKSPLTLDVYKSYVKDFTLVPFLSGRCDENGKVSFKGEIPASVKEIYAYSFGIGVPTLMKATVSDEGVVSEFKVTEVKAAVTSRAPSNTTSWKTYSVTLSKPTLPAVSKAISEEDKKLIDKSFSLNQNYDVVNTFYQPCIRLNEKARVKIYSVSQGVNSDRTNALAYYVYQDEMIQPKDINSNLQLVFPELTKSKPAEGAGYQLLNNGEETFEAGSRIGFALFPDITPGNITTSNTHVLYSSYETGSWNTYSFAGLSRASAPHMVMSLLRVDKDGHAIIAIGFEDQPWSANFGTNRGDFRDDIFILEVDPASSLPGDLPTPPTDEPTYDRKFISSGILCFEDSWPAKGDYDLNDVVIAYERTLYQKNDYTTVKMEEIYTFLHNGATYANGFGYQLLGVSGGLERSSVKDCVVKSDYEFKGKGLDLTLDDAVVVLFDNTKSVKVRTTFSVTTTFFDGAYFTGLNPFIVTAGNNSGLVNILEKDRIEIHLPMAKSSKYKYLPTSKANITFWGTQDDRSVPASKIYYVRDSNYPFAIDIAWDSETYGGVGNFVIPTEQLSIEKTYPDFTGWVTSDGKKNTDWQYKPKK